MPLKADNVLGLLIVLIPVLLLAYVTARNIGWLDVTKDLGMSSSEKENFAGNVRNRNFDDPNWRNGVFYQRKDKQMLPTNPVMAPTFSVEQFDNQVKGWSNDGLDGVVENLETGVRRANLDNPNWLGGVFYQKRNELGKLVPTNPIMVGEAPAVGGVGNGGDLAETNDLREGFLDIGFGEAVRDGINTLMGRSSDRDLPSVNPDLSYVKTQPDIPFFDPRVGSVRDAPTAAVKIPVLVDEKPALSRKLNNGMKADDGLTLKQMSANMLAADTHKGVIDKVAEETTDIGMDLVNKGLSKELGFGPAGKAGKVPLSNEKGVLQKLYGSEKTDGGLKMVKSGKRSFGDDADEVKPLVSGKVVCLAYPIMRDGKLKQVNISNNGNDYKETPKVRAVGGNPIRAAKLKAVVDGSGAVVIIDIVDEGEGYKTTPEIVVTEP